MKKVGLFVFWVALLVLATFFMCCRTLYSIGTGVGQRQERDEAVKAEMGAWYIEFDADGHEFIRFRYFTKIEIVDHCLAEHHAEKQAKEE